MKKWILALGTCAALSTLPLGAFAHGYDAGDAALGGLVGGVVGGLISSGVVAAPVYAAPGPVVVERYAPPPVVVERPAPVVVGRGEPSVVYYDGDRRGWWGHRWREHEWREHEWRGHRWHRHHWDDDD
jgi:hypothetical protein